jgi:hypothetical protein
MTTPDIKAQLEALEAMAKQEAQDRVRRERVPFARGNDLPAFDITELMVPLTTRRLRR